MHTGSEQSVTGGEFKKFLKHYQLSKHFKIFGKGWGGDRLTEDQFGTALQASAPGELRGALGRLGYLCAEGGKAMFVAAADL